ncbi:MAG: DUF6600 domain-containing protein [Limisphaerales bacterium]
MKTYDFSDRKVKVLLVLAILIMGWLCFQGALTGHAQAVSNNPNVQEIVKLSKAHMSDDVILSYIKNSGVSYSLSADDILYLNSQGVSQPVISALLQAQPSGPPPQSAPPPMAPPFAPGANAPLTQQPQVSPYPTPYPVPQPTTPPPPVPDASAGPLPGSEVTLPYFQTQLSPYGAWVDVPGYGPCWRPSITTQDPDWRPYFNGGHWEYTDDGWFWRSDYPWGEYVFHYGRWARDPRFGWLWIPGYHWGPAWVCWRNAEAEGFCGWAPLPPGARFELGVGLTWNGRVAVDADFGLAPDAFVFVGFDHFWARDYRLFAAPPWRVSILFHRSFLANNYRFVGGHFFVGGIGRERVAALTHHDVVAGRIDFHDSRIAHEREIQHDRGREIERSREAGRGGEREHR